MKDETCIFCKIIEGKIPSYTIYEDESVKAFLDINPATEGHLLVIPKNHYRNIFDIPKKELESVAKIAQNLSKTVKEKLGAGGVNLLNSNETVAQQDVFHFHMHLIPRYEGEMFKIMLENPAQKKSQEELKKIADKIRN